MIEQGSSVSIALISKATAHPHFGTPSNMSFTGQNLNVRCKLSIPWGRVDIILDNGRRPIMLCRTPVNF